MGILINWLISRCIYLRKKTKNSNCYCHSHLCSCCHSTSDNQAQDPAVSLQRIPPHLEEQDEHCPNHGAEKGCCVRNCRSLKRRLIRARNSFRDKVEFAEYGKEYTKNYMCHRVQDRFVILYQTALFLIIHCRANRCGSSNEFGSWKINIVVPTLNTTLY